MTPDAAAMETLADEATALLKSLAHPARLIICCQLRDEEMSVSEIEGRLGIKQPRLSRELAKLREEGIVETRKQSKLVYYRLASSSRVRAMVDAICAVMLDGQYAPMRATAKDRAAPTGGFGVFATVQD